jgi:septum formation protein
VVGLAARDAPATIGSVSAPELYLASTSPRRHMLLQQAGVVFEFCAPGEENGGEDPQVAVAPKQLALERARRKALGAACVDPLVPVLGVDTVVDVDGVELGKPRDRAEAESMLRRLVGRTHLVHTAHCCVLPESGARHERVVSATVAGGEPTAAELQAYLDSGDWEGKAGAYGIQDATQKFLRVVEGDFDTVMGLHADAVRQLLARCRGSA